MNTINEIAYFWTLNDVVAFSQQEGFQNVIYKVDWTYTGINSSGITASTRAYCNFQLDSENFVSSENLNKTCVINWLEQKLDHLIPTMKSNLENQINNQSIPLKVSLNLQD